MKNPHAKIATLLRTEEKVLWELEEKMHGVTGKRGVIEKIADENDILVKKTLKEFGLQGNSSAEEVYHALIERLIFLDGQIYEILGHPDLLKEEGAKTLIKKGLETSDSKQGLFLKEEKAREMLVATPPPNIMKIFGYQSIEELMANESLLEIYSAMRFLEDTKWMNENFIKNYETLTINDFEERPVEVFVLSQKWVDAAKQFILKKKYHNLSHLKELGVIFIVPMEIGTQGETTRLFSLLLHYLNEVPFYSSLFRRHGNDVDFPQKLMALLRGDVLDGPLPASNKVQWRIVQRYLAKDNAWDPRLLEPHVNPEAEHWYKAEEDLGRLDGTKHVTGGAFGYWTGMDFVGDAFTSASGSETIVSFDLIDLVMSLVLKGDVKYLYHQQEALWNKIFIEYFSRDEMNQLVDENIIKGYIEL
jgi:hypothetical protein